MREVVCVLWGGRVAGESPTVRLQIQRERKQRFLDQRDRWMCRKGHQDDIHPGNKVTDGFISYGLSKGLGYMQTVHCTEPFQIPSCSSALDNSVFPLPLSVLPNTLTNIFFVVRRNQLLHLLDDLFVKVFSKHVTLFLCWHHGQFLSRHST